MCIVVKSCLTFELEYKIKVRVFLLLGGREGLKKKIQKGGGGALPIYHSDSDNG